VGEENLKIYISEFYEKLFGDPDNNRFSMMEEHVDDILDLSTEENVLLAADFTEEKVLEAIS
jgi:hypothetical protein